MSSQIPPVSPSHGQNPLDDENGIEDIQIPQIVYSVNAQGELIKMLDTDGDGIGDVVFGS